MIGGGVLEVRVVGGRERVVVGECADERVQMVLELVRVDHAGDHRQRVVRVRLHAALEVRRKHTAVRYRHRR